MRILIVVPPQDRTTGNWVSARRWQRGLAEYGHRVELCPAEVQGLRRATPDRFDLALLLHVWRSGHPWQQSGSTVPYLAVMTGTDCRREGLTPAQRQVCDVVLQHAAGIIVKNREVFTAVSHRQPQLAARLSLLRPGVELDGDVPCPLRNELGIGNDEVLFLCPAGLRPVKGVLELLEFCDRLETTTPYHVAFCGPDRDAGYARQFMAAVQERPWASYLGNLDRRRMPAAMREADVILNNSLVEGLSNALAEAVTLGRPILARAIPGNLDVVEDGRNGLLYRTAPEFIRAAGRLIDDPQLRSRLSHPDPERFSVRREARELETLCRNAVAAGKDTNHTGGKHHVR